MQDTLRNCARGCLSQKRRSRKIPRRSMQANCIGSRPSALMKPIVCEMNFSGRYKRRLCAIVLSADNYGRIVRAVAERTLLRVVRGPVRCRVCMEIAVPYRTDFGSFDRRSIYVRRLCQGVIMYCLVPCILANFWRGPNVKLIT